MSASSSSSRTHTVESSLWKCLVCLVSCLAGENSRSKYSRESTTNENGRVRWHTRPWANFYAILLVDSNRSSSFFSSLLVHYFSPLGIYPLPNLGLTDSLPSAVKPPYCNRGTFPANSIPKSIWKINHPPCRSLAVTRVKCERKHFESVEITSTAFGKWLHHKKWCSNKSGEWIDCCF